MCMGQTVAWYVFSFGANEALFSPMFAGNSYTSDGNNRESNILITGMSDTYMMKPHEPGMYSSNVFLAYFRLYFTTRLGSNQLAKSQI